MRDMQKYIHGSNGLEATETVEVVATAAVPKTTTGPLVVAAVGALTEHEPVASVYVDI